MVAKSSEAARQQTYLWSNAAKAVPATFRVLSILSTACWHTRAIISWTTSSGNRPGSSATTILVRVCKISFYEEWKLRILLAYTFINCIFLILFTIGDRTISPETKFSWERFDNWFYMIKKCLTKWAKVCHWKVWANSARR